VLFDKIASVYFIGEIYILYIIFILYFIYILALEMVSPGNQHCANCIGQIFVPYKATAKIIPLRCKKTTKRY